MSTVGILKWFAFDKDKRYGVLIDHDSSEYFIHGSNLNYEISTSDLDTLFIFNVFENNRGLNATNCRTLYSWDDLEVVFKLLGESATVFIKRDRDHVAFDFIELALKSYINANSTTELIDNLIEYFDSSLDLSHYLEIARYIDRLITSDEKLDFFLHASKNLSEEVLFNAWSTKQFHLIGYPNTDDQEDYEIDIGIIKKHIPDLNFNNLSRILNYEDGLNSIYEIIETAILYDYITPYQYKMIEACYDNEVFELNEHLKQKISEFLLSEYQQKLNNEILKCLPFDSIIQADSMYNSFKDYFLDKSEKLNQLANRYLSKSIAEKFDPTQKHKLLIHNIINSLTDQDVINVLVDDQMDRTTIIDVLCKCDHHQFQLLSNHPNHHETFEMLDICADVFRKMNNLSTYHFTLQSTITNSSLLSGKKGLHVIDYALNLINTETNGKVNYQLFQQGYPRKLDLADVLDSIEQFTVENHNSVLKSNCLNSDELNLVLMAYIDVLYQTNDETKTNPELDQCLSTEDFKLLNFLLHNTPALNSPLLKDDQVIKLQSILSSTQSFNIWEDGFVGNASLPKDQIIETILDYRCELFLQSESKFGLTQIEDMQPKNSNNLRWQGWATKGLISKQDLSQIIIKELISTISCDTKEHSINSYKLVCFAFQNQIMTKSELLTISDCGLIQFLMWLLDLQLTSLDFQHFSQNIFRLPFRLQQFSIKKLFACTKANVIACDIKQLNNLMEKSAKSAMHNHFFDINSLLIINALAQFVDSQEFLNMGRILQLIIDNHDESRHPKYKLSGFFNKCRGRTLMGFDNITNGTVSLDENKTLFSVKFDYSDDLVEAVKKVPGRRWNASESCWSVPYSAKRELFEFIKENKFEIELANKGFKTSNKHLFFEDINKVPHGRMLCDGRLANKMDDFHKIPFWWCNGSKCYHSCVKTSISEDWSDLTFIDFANILGFELDSKKWNSEEIITNGKYLQFVSTINRVNQLLEKLYCVDCKHFLHPYEVSHFASFTVVKFKCVNSSCSVCNQEEIIYLNHCFNSKCNAIVDSRVSKKCSNGLYICENCGSCCSQQFFQRRLNTLEQADDFSIAQRSFIYLETKKAFDSKLGHLERAEYFCHLDGHRMKEVDDDHFICTTCRTEYNTKIYNHKRPNKVLPLPSIRAQQVINPDPDDLPY